MGVSRVLSRLGPGRMVIGGMLTPAAMSAASMAMGCCWLEMALWKIGVRYLASLGKLIYARPVT